MDLIQLTPAGLVLDGITGLPIVEINSNPNLPSVSLGNLENAANFRIKYNPALLSIVSDLLSVSAGHLIISHNAVLTSVALNALSFVKSSLDFRSNTVLETISLPSLISAATHARYTFITEKCPALANISCPGYLPNNTNYQMFRDCALTEATVDHLLSRCVANAGYVSGLVALEGGTNSPPSVVGLADVATLRARGVVVTHN